MAKKVEKIETTQDPLTEARNALNVYQGMKNSIQFFNDMLDFHIKQAQSVIKKMEKAEEEALSKQTEIFNEKP